MAGFDVEFLPREEPGNPLRRVSPDFTDRLMVHIREERRRYIRRRRGTIVRAGMGIIALTWLALRPLSGPVHYDIPVAHVRPHSIETPRHVPPAIVPKLEPPRIAHATPKAHKVPKPKDAPVLQAVPLQQAVPNHQDELIPLCRDILPAAFKAGERCISTPDPSLPQPTVHTAPGRKHLPAPEPPKPDTAETTTSPPKEP